MPNCANMNIKTEGDIIVWADYACAELKAVISISDAYTFLLQF